MTAAAEEASHTEQPYFDALVKPLYPTILAPWLG